MVSQAQQMAESLRPFRQTLLTHPNQHSPVMGHRRHAKLYGGPLRSFIAKLANPPAEQTGNVTFHHWTAVPTGTGQLHLRGSAVAVQAGGIEPSEDLLRRRGGIDGLNRVGDPDGEYAPRMQNLPHGGVVDAEVTCHQMDGQFAGGRGPLQGVLDFINQRHHIAGIGGIPDRCMHGKDKTCRGL